MSFEQRGIRLIKSADILARLSIYFLSDSSSSFAPLLKPLFTAKTVSDTLVTILLDWAEPWSWVRQVRDWIRLLRQVISSLDDETKVKMEEAMQAWQQRRGPIQDSGGGGVTEGNVTIPLGPGEWDEAVGLPLCVVCHSVSILPLLVINLNRQESSY